MKKREDFLLPLQPGRACGCWSVAGYRLAVRLAGRFERLSEVFLQVFDVLDAHGDAHGTRPDARRTEFRFAQLRVRGGGRMGDARLGVAQVDQPLGQLHAVQERLARLEAAFEIEREERT